MTAEVEYLKSTKLVDAFEDFLIKVAREGYTQNIFQEAADFLLAWQRDKAALLYDSKIKSTGGKASPFGSPRGLTSPRGALLTSPRSASVPVLSPRARLVAAMGGGNTSAAPVATVAPAAGGAVSPAATPKPATADDAAEDPLADSPDAAITLDSLPVLSRPRSLSKSSAHSDASDMTDLTTEDESDGSVSASENSNRIDPVAELKKLSIISSSPAPQSTPQPLTPLAVLTPATSPFTPSQTPITLPHAAPVPLGLTRGASTPNISFGSPSPFLNSPLANPSPSLSSAALDIIASVRKTLPPLKANPFLSGSPLPSPSPALGGTATLLSGAGMGSITLSTLSKQGAPATAPPQSLEQESVHSSQHSDKLDSKSGNTANIEDGETNCKSQSGHSVSDLDLEEELDSKSQISDNEEQLHGKSQSELSELDLGEEVLNSKNLSELSDLDIDEELSNKGQSISEPPQQKSQLSGASASITSQASGGGAGGGGHSLASSGHSSLAALSHQPPSMPPPSQYGKVAATSAVAPAAGGSQSASRSRSGSGSLGKEGSGSRHSSVNSLSPRVPPPAAGSGNDTAVDAAGRASEASLHSCDVSLRDSQLSGSLRDSDLSGSLRDSQSGGPAQQPGSMPASQASGSLRASQVSGLSGASGSQRSGSVRASQVSALSAASGSAQPSQVGGQPVFHTHTPTLHVYFTRVDSLCILQASGLSGASCSVRASQVSGSLRASQVSGSVRASQVSGSLRASQVSGLSNSLAASSQLSESLPDEQIEEQGDQDSIHTGSLLSNSVLHSGSGSGSLEELDLGSSREGAPLQAQPSQQPQGPQPQPKPAHEHDELSGELFSELSDLALTESGDEAAGKSAADAKRSHSGSGSGSVSVSGSGSGSELDDISFEELSGVSTKGQRQSQGSPTAGVGGSAGVSVLSDTHTSQLEDSDVRALRASQASGLAEGDALSGSGELSLSGTGDEAAK
eukprot:TRINITY_DN4543_c0_g3_i2.p1 TRINITY_DN4543_c0_g3~~TRINITY_DN4543_c0_g3_i2.p1  ORF type:complete len:977 (-),score=177.89 TRINITY_DN4543_c0_g3_i2:54-2960(-)